MAVLKAGLDLAGTFQAWRLTQRRPGRDGDIQSALATSRLLLEAADLGCDMELDVQPSLYMSQVSYYI